MIQKKRFVAVLSVVLFSVVGGVLLTRTLQTRKPQAKLEKLADAMAWNNNWIGAARLYKQAEFMALGQHDEKKALLNWLGQVPARMETVATLPSLISEVDQRSSDPAARDPKVKLRLLTIRGMLELEYDASIAKKTWAQVERLANAQYEWKLASRASGEQGILAFMLGNVGEAADRVKGAYLKSRILGDRAAQVRFAELIGAGISAIGRPKESLKWLDEAISVAKAHPEIARPQIAFSGKIRSLSELGRFGEAERLAEEALRYPRSHRLAGHLDALLEAKGKSYELQGSWKQAVAAYSEAAWWAGSIQFIRGVTEANEKLARAYEHQGLLQQALAAIDLAIAANRKIPDELYLMPRVLSTKARIESRMGLRKRAEADYRKSSDFMDGLLLKAPTPRIQQLLMSELAELYSGYFAFLSDDARFEEAFHVIESAHGRTETQALQYDRLDKPHQATSMEKHIDQLEAQLLDVDDPVQRAKIVDAIYDFEFQITPTVVRMSETPLPLVNLQRIIGADEVVLEFVLADPRSYVLAITPKTVARHVLPSKAELERSAMEYRNAIRHRKATIDQGQKLYASLLGKIPELNGSRKVVVIPDGQLGLLPFASLVDKSGQYLIEKKVVSIVPSGTVFALLRSKGSSPQQAPLPYLGVAAWTQTADGRPWFARALSGPVRSELTPLPASQAEVESIAKLLPQPAKILLGSKATEGEFTRLPLAQFDVLHLALHGYADAEFPDRSALVFASRAGTGDSGMLQAREICKLRLKAQLVTLSACNTGVGPVSEGGVSNLASAFIQGGAQAVVSTLWEIEDNSTKDIMSGFYKNLAIGTGKAEALRRAQVSSLKSGLAPYYWASFQLVGEPANPLRFGIDVTTQAVATDRIKKKAVN